MDIQEHPNCKKCKLHEGCLSPWMDSGGSEEPLILAVGEAPGAQEDQEGIPFIGKSGKVLRAALKEVLGGSLDDVRFTNVVRCRPPGNKVTARAIKYCKHYVLEEIEHYKPPLVLLFGSTSLKAILGETGITTWNGIVIKREEAIYVPLYHPAYVLRNPNITDDWANGMINAVDALLGEEEEKEEFQFIQPRTAWELIEMRDQLLESEWIAYDTETTTLDPTEEIAKIVAISISDGDHTYAFPVEHEDAHWTIGDKKTLNIVMSDIYEQHQGKIIGHNLKFDLQHTINQFGFDFQSGGDSMLASHLVDSRKGIHSLKRLAGLHLGMYDYDKDLQDYIRENPEANPYKGGNYGNIPLDLLIPYAAMDAYATYKLHWILYEKLSKKQKEFYHEVVIPGSDMLGYVEYTGFKVDQFIVGRYVHIYEARRQEVFEEIQKDPNIPDTVEILQKRSDDKMILDMYPYELNGKGPPPLEFYEVTEGRIKFDDGEKKRNRKRPLVEFNPNSAHQLRVLYYDVCNIPVDPDLLTPTGLTPTGKDIVRPYKEDFPIVERIRYHNLLAKVLSTYLVPAKERWSKTDGRVHSTYSQDGSVTGRLASSGPNLQNIPAPDKEPGTLLAWLPVKNILTSSFPNGVILCVDYSGIELRVYASLADCDVMLEIHRSGRDFHSMIASRITGIPYDQIEKSTRGFYKNVNFAMLYRGNEYTLNTKFGIPLEAAKEAIYNYNEELPSIEIFAKKCIKFAVKHGYIESPFGRRESLPYIGDTTGMNEAKRRYNIRQAVNMRVQSGASDLVLAAATILDGEMYRRRLDSRIVNVVHDEVVLDVPRHEIETTKELSVDVLENVGGYAKLYMPRIDFSWIKCPLEAEVEIGSHYGTVIGYKDWLNEQN